MVQLPADYKGVSFYPTGETGRGGRVIWCVVGGDLKYWAPRIGWVIIPEGFTFDGPSIPWIAIPFMPAGAMFVPSALHDYLVRKQLCVSKYICDAAFYDALVEQGVNEFVARICFTAVQTKRTRD